MAMAQFTGTLRIEGDRGSPLPVKAEISDNRLVLTTEGSDLGSWPLASLQPQARGAGVGLTLDGDPVVIDVGNADRFYDAVVGTAASGTKKGRRSRAKVAKPIAPSVSDESSAETPTSSGDAGVGRRLPPPRVLVAVGLLVAVVVAGVLAPTLMGAIALFLGLVLVLIASGATVDPRVALRLPFGLQAMHVMVAGVGVLLVGGALTFLG